MEDSVLYKLSNKKRLAKILFSELGELKQYTDDSGYRCFSQKSGEKIREIQEPVGPLDRIHTRVASLLLRIEAFEGLHSGRKGFSNITNARAHIGIGKRIITADLKKFFPSTNRLSVFDFFYNSMKCSPDVADLLSKILTYNGMVPTGSRVSMPLAYFANMRMFNELSELSHSYGATMTIFVDDLTFSGAFLERPFISKVECIAKKYGHRLHPAKTRFYREGDPKIITGAVVKNNQIYPRNRHLLQISEDINRWVKGDSGSELVANRALGRLSFVGSIDRRHKDRARTLRRALYQKKIGKVFSS